MRILDHYIARNIIYASLIVSAIIITLQSFLLLMQQLHYVGDANYSVGKAIQFVLMQLPAQFYQIFPMIGFFGALIGLTRLSTTSQLIVMRASGVSILRILWSVVKTGLYLIIIVTVLGEGVGPTWQQESEHMRHLALFPPVENSILESVWLHHGDSFTYISKLKNNEEMDAITRYRFAQSGRLKEAILAKMGRFEHGQWILSGLKKTEFKNNAVTLQTEKHAGLHVAFQPTLQLEMSIISAQQTITDLYRTIRYRETIGLDVNSYVYSYWQRLLQPFTTLVMICLAVPFVFGSFRNTSMGVRMIGGVVIGFVFYMMNQLFGPITMVYQFPPIFAAIIPTCLFLCIVAILLATTK